MKVLSALIIMLFSWANVAPAWAENHRQQPAQKQAPAVQKAPAQQRAPAKPQLTRPQQQRIPAGQPRVIHPQRQPRVQEVRPGAPIQPRTPATQRQKPQQYQQKVPAGEFRRPAEKRAPAIRQQATRQGPIQRFAPGVRYRELPNRQWVIERGHNHYVWYNNSYHRYRTKIFFPGNYYYPAGYYYYNYADGCYYDNPNFIGIGIAAAVFGILALIVVSAAEAAALEAINY